jgi:uncharacterized protein YkwD
VWPNAALNKVVVRLGTIAALGVLAVGLAASVGGLVRSHRGSSGSSRAALPIAAAVVRPLPARYAATVALTFTPATALPVSTTTGTDTTTSTTTANTTNTALTKRAVHDTAASRAGHPQVIAQPPSPAPDPAAAPAAAAAGAQAPAPAPLPAATASAPAATASAPTPAATAPATIADPPASISPSAQMQSACWTTPNIAGCNTASLASINQARAAEGLGPLELPWNFYALDTKGQVVAVVNSERTSRNLAAFSYSTAYEPAAEASALAGTDPTGPAGMQWASIYAAGYPTALAADFAWMYDDGPGGTNIACTATVTSGCWGHRAAILSPWGGTASAAAAIVEGALSLSVLFVSG